MSEQQLLRRLWSAGRWDLLQEVKNDPSCKDRIFGWVKQQLAAGGTLRKTKKC